MAIQQFNLKVTAPAKGLFDITGRVAAWVDEKNLKTGLLTLFIRHTSASLTIQENADPDVLCDLEAFFDRSVPEDSALYRHMTEGPDDMPAHIRAALTATLLSIPVSGGRMLLGTWQGIYLWEHRAVPQERQIVLHFDGMIDDPNS